MYRGIFKFIKSQDAYSSTEKKWFVSLLQTECFWYDMLLAPPEEVNTRKLIKEHIQSIEGYLENNIEKRFIYFLGSRKKVRFSTKYTPKYSHAKNELNLILLVGKNREKKKITVPDFFYDQTIRYNTDIVFEVTDKYLYLKVDNVIIDICSIHDFLRERYINLGYNTEVHYVGYTKNPQSRPIDGIHRGFSNMLYNTSNEDNDFFVFFNLFNPTSLSSNDSYNMNFCISNSLMNEIDLDKEGKIIEKCFINYFNSVIQNNEITGLTKNLRNFANKYNMRSIAINLEYESPNEYYSYYSRCITPRFHHFFVFKLDGKNLFLDKKIDKDTYLKSSPLYINE
ncbi:hypothetical protein I2492_01915 [Budviciaceae bacterium CWB-B4]|uniref:Uncharacterized protein n=1 Tax=Limnobaculum xujianqingii TaxID=2738837 RepID=A0A9D7FQN2_9GAMM|nr:hypothetical protein [Limnobaculum xujianqingii]MBK5071773.1 hypothetical protein [Limnobaculum xujianqingii]MBK5175082.1 hypothetical protein [Limnobaculum xujianqingii]